MSTFLEIANNVAIKVRLPELTTCFSSSIRNAKVIKLAIIDGAKYDIFHAKHNWSFLIKQHSFNTSNGVEGYNVPSDFDRMIPQSVWNATSDLLVTGPIDPSKWAEYKNNPNSISILRYACAILPSTTGTKQLKLVPTPTATESITYFYVSNKYVVTGGNLASEFASDGDTTLFDAKLLEQAALYRTLSSLGMDYGEEAYQFREMLSERTSNDGGADVLTLDKPGDFLLLNIPETGYGS